MCLVDHGEGHPLQLLFIISCKRGVRAISVYAAKKMSQKLFFLHILLSVAAAPAPPFCVRIRLNVNTGRQINLIFILLLYELSKAYSSSCLISFAMGRRRREGAPSWHTAHLAARFNELLITPAARLCQIIHATPSDNVRF